MIDRRFHVNHGLYFERLSAGGVRLVRTDGPAPDAGGVVLFEQVIDDGIWGSLVLTMSHFNERPGDWHPFMDHHHGRRDLLAEGK